MSLPAYSPFATREPAHFQIKSWPHKHLLTNAVLGHSPPTGYQWGGKGKRESTTRGSLAQFSSQPILPLTDPTRTTSNSTNKPISQCALPPWKHSVRNKWVCKKRMPLSNHDHPARNQPARTQSSTPASAWPSNYSDNTQSEPSFLLLYLLSTPL